MCSRRKVKALVLLVIVSGATLLLEDSCGKKINAEPSIADYLPDQTASGLRRSGEIRQYNRETLWEYLPGGVDLYLNHGFTRMASAEYRFHNLEFSADVYEFDSPESARQLSAIIRPPDVLKDVDIGDDGYLDPGILALVCGSYLVRVTGYIDTQESQDLLADLADAIVRRMHVQRGGASQ